MTFTPTFAWPEAEGIGRAEDGGELEEGADDGEEGEEGEEEEEEEEESEVFVSSVVVLTADYAMQNVILQMNMRLLAGASTRPLFSST